MEAKMTLNASIHNPNYYPISFQDLNLRVYDYKGDDIGSVVKDGVVTIPARKTINYEIEAVVKPGVEQLLDLSKNCLKNKQHTNIRVQGTVKGRLFPKGGPTFKMPVGPLDQPDSKCITPADFLDQITKHGLGKGTGQVVGGLIKGVDKIRHGDVGEGIASTIPGGESVYHSINDVVDSISGAFGGKKKNKKAPAPEEAATPAPATPATTTPATTPAPAQPAVVDNDNSLPMVNLSADEPTADDTTTKTQRRNKKSDDKGSSSSDGVISDLKDALGDLPDQLESGIKKLGNTLSGKKKKATTTTDDDATAATDDDKPTKTGDDILGTITDAFGDLPKKLANGVQKLGDRIQGDDDKQQQEPTAN